MTGRKNHLGLPIGVALPDWKPVTRPPRTPMAGTRCRVEPVDPARHADDLFEVFTEDKDGRIWTYLTYGPFETMAAFRPWLEDLAKSDDPLFHAIVDERSGRALGMASFLRIDPGNGVIEVGHINYSPRLQRTAVATDAMFVMMRRVFAELGYRRYEWKCDALNAASRRAAERLGFVFEGVFRQALVYKGRNRDTAWYAITDSEWPALRQAYESWLDPENFDADGRQKQKLADLIAGARG